jgi:hypothetical protein
MSSGGRGARTILYKIVEARVVIVSGRLGGKPAEDGAGVGGRRRVRQEGHGKDGVRVRERRRRGHKMVEQASPRGVFEGGPQGRRWRV